MFIKQIVIVKQFFNENCQFLFCVFSALNLQKAQSGTKLRLITKYLNKL